MIDNGGVRTLLLEKNNNHGNNTKKSHALPNREPDIRHWKPKTKEEEEIPLGIRKLP